MARPLLRKTASFTNIEKIVEDNGEDEDDNDNFNRPANHQNGAHKNGTNNKVKLQGALQ